MDRRRKTQTRGSRGKLFLGLFLVLGTTTTPSAHHVFLHFIVLFLLFRRQNSADFWLIGVEDFHGLGPLGISLQRTVLTNGIHFLLTRIEDGFELSLLR